MRFYFKTRYERYLRQKPQRQQRRRRIKKIKGRIEPAHFWGNRQKRKYEIIYREQNSPPNTYLEASLKFFNVTEYGGTSVSFVDLSLKSCIQWVKRYPIVEIRDDGNWKHIDYGANTGKTKTLVQMAARYVVSTRPTLYDESADYYEKDYLNKPRTLPALTLPKVIFIDSTMDVTPLMLAIEVKNQILQDPNFNAETINRDMKNCFERIHIIQANQVREIINSIEELHCDMYSTRKTDCPTLILWDGFLTELADNFLQKEVARPFARILRDCEAAFFYTRTSRWPLKQSFFYAPPLKKNRPKDYVRVDPYLQSIILERDQSKHRKHDFRAKVLKSRYCVPYNLSATGVLN